MLQLRLQRAYHEIKFEKYHLHVNSSDVMDRKKNNEYTMDY